MPWFGNFLGAPIYPEDQGAQGQASQQAASGSPSDSIRSDGSSVSAGVFYAEESLPPVEAWTTGRGTILLPPILPSLHAGAAERASLPEQEEPPVQTLSRQATNEQDQEEGANTLNVPSSPSTAQLTTSTQSPGWLSALKLPNSMRSSPLRASQVHQAGLSQSVSGAHGSTRFSTGEARTVNTPTADATPSTPRRLRGVMLGAAVMNSLRSMIGSSNGRADSDGSRRNLLGGTASESGGLGVRVLNRMRNSFIHSASGARDRVLPMNDGTHPIQYDDDATASLLHAVKVGDVHEALTALRARADPHAHDKQHMDLAPLHFAAAQGRTDSSKNPQYTQEIAHQLVNVLIKYGAQASQPDSMGYTPLHLAAYHGNLPAVRALLATNEQPRQLEQMLLQQDWQIRYTALHCAVAGNQAGAVVELLLQGASHKTQDYTSLTPWSLCAQHHFQWGLELITELNISLATNRHLPAGAVLQLALELRRLEVVPVVLRAAARWPQQVWQLMRAAIASGLHEFVELLSEDIPVVCPAALLELPWADVMVELATRFPSCFKTLILGLNVVDFDAIVIPFIKGLNFDGDATSDDAHSLNSTTSPTSPLMKQNSELKQFDAPATPKRLRRQSSVQSEDGHEFKPQSRMKSMMSLKSMLVLGKREDLSNHSQTGNTGEHGLPEAVKYLLLRCLVSSLADLEWKVWQALVGGLHGSVALEIARFPKLFKRLTDSIASRVVPQWVPPFERARSRNRQQMQQGEQDDRHVCLNYDQHRLLNVNHIMSAAIASRSSANVYNAVCAMDNWLNLNPACYLAHLEPASIATLAAEYPDACRLLFTFEAQGHTEVKVPAYLLTSTMPGRTVFRCAELDHAFIWQDDGLIALHGLGITDLDRIQTWVLKGVTFDSLLKLFKTTAPSCHTSEVAGQLDHLLSCGLTGKDVNKLIQLDADLNGVVDALEGGLSAEFVHQMLEKKISFQVVTEMLDMEVSRVTQWNNVRHQPVWGRFPRESWRDGITYEFIRIFFESWEEYNFDKRFIDLMFDFHDPMFVKLRTALEYVNSNKALAISLAEQQQAVKAARKAREIFKLSTLSDAFLQQQFYSPQRACIVALVYLGGAVSTRMNETVMPSMMRFANMMMGKTGTDRLVESPKVDVIGETLPMINIAQLGSQCYLRALVNANAPASMFGLPVVESLIQVKWSSYGSMFMVLLFVEHLLLLGMTVIYLFLVNIENEVCSIESTSLTSGNELAQCKIGIATLGLDLGLILLTVYPLTVYVRQLHSLGLNGWLAQPANLASILTVALQLATVMGHLSRRHEVLQACISLLVLLQFLRMGWFAILNERMGALVRIVGQILSDTMYFLCLLAMLYAGFALAFYTLSDGNGTDGISKGELALKLFTLMLGDVQADFFADVVIGTFALPYLSFLLMVAYTALLLIVAVNMLVAIMNDTFNRIKVSEKNELLKSKAMVLVDIESGLSPSLLQMLQRDLMGKYLHLLRRKDLDADMRESIARSAKQDLAAMNGNMSTDGAASTWRSNSGQITMPSSLRPMPETLVNSFERSRSETHGPPQRPKSAMKRNNLEGLQSQQSKMVRAQSRAAQHQLGGKPTLRTAHGSKNARRSAISRDPSFTAGAGSIHSRPSEDRSVKGFDLGSLEGGHRKVAIEDDALTSSQPPRAQDYQRRMSTRFVNVVPAMPGAARSKVSDNSVVLPTGESMSSSDRSSPGELHARFSEPDPPPAPPTDGPAQQAVLAAQSRVVRLVSRRISHGWASSLLLTPAEALQEDIHRPGDNSDDESWHDDELLMPPKRVTYSGVEHHSLPPPQHHPGMEPERTRQVTTRPSFIGHDDDDMLPDYGDDPLDGYDSEEEESRVREILSAVSFTSQHRGQSARYGGLNALNESMARGSRGTGGSQPLNESIRTSRSRMAPPASMPPRPPALKHASGPKSSHTGPSPLVNSTSQTQRDQLAAPSPDAHSNTGTNEHGVAHAGPVNDSLPSGEETHERSSGDQYDRASDVMQREEPAAHSGSSSQGHKPSADDNSTEDGGDGGGGDADASAEEVGRVQDTADV